jgi:hypothetical protein
MAGPSLNAKRPHTKLPRLPDGFDRFGTVGYCRLFHVGDRSSDVLSLSSFLLSALIIPKSNCSGAQSWQSAFRSVLQSSSGSRTPMNAPHDLHQSTICFAWPWNVRRKGPFDIFVPSNAIGKAPKNVSDFSSVHARFTRHILVSIIRMFRASKQIHQCRRRHWFHEMMVKPSQTQHSQCGGLLGDPSR